MSANTKIEWCDHTFNPWEGCQKVSPGCDHCYAESRNARFGGGVAQNWGPDAPRRRTSAANWRQPLAWDKQPFCKCIICGWSGEVRDFVRIDAAGAKHQMCPGCGGSDWTPARARVFCASLADVFDNAVPPEWRAGLFALIANTPNLDWLLLTKRIGNVSKMLDELRHPSDEDLSLLDMMPLPNVWIGATIVNQDEADRDIPKLLAVPASKRFLSMEPLLSRVDIWPYTKPHCERHRGALDSDGRCEICEGRGLWSLGDQLDETEKAPIRPGIDWVIVGGESGPGARPMHPDWAQSLRDDCQEAGVPFLFKQWGEWLPISQATEGFTRSLYKSSRIAKPHEDQDVIDDMYGRTCTVDYSIQHADGSLHGPTEPMAFLQGTGAMQTFKVGKKAAGRQLDGRTHDGFPT